jgi:predicted DsbA family dithiol-disulfide isomerase
LTAPLTVRVYYDFASTLCYVAHRRLRALRPRIGDLGVELEFCPIELSRLLGYRPGAIVDESRRSNAARVAAELDVPVRVPRVWPDVRLLSAAAVLAEPTGRGPSWRERAFTAVFEEGIVAVDAETTLRLAREISLDLTEAALDEATETLAGACENAREEGVSGVPTFMLGRWPFAGIQSDDTMLAVLERFARKTAQSVGGSTPPSSGGRTR